METESIAPALGGIDPEARMAHYLTASAIAARALKLPSFMFTVVSGTSMRFRWSRSWLLSAFPTA